MIAGLVVGLVAYIFSALMFVFYEKLPLVRLIPLTFIVIVPALAIALGILPTIIFSIHIESGWVEHRIFNKWVISRAQASNFIEMEPPASFPARLVFSDGTRIRLVGGTMAILRELETELLKRTEEAEQDAT